MLFFYFPSSFIYSNLKKRKSSQLLRWRKKRIVDNTAAQSVKISFFIKYAGKC